MSNTTSADVAPVSVCLLLEVLLKPINGKSVISTQQPDALGRCHTDIYYEDLVLDFNK
jgi:hypothetical protein